jgi:creatinine amidohydrolase
MTYVDYKGLSWPEAGALAGQGRVVGLIGVAALEQHGPQLPLGTDALIGEVLARRVAEAFVEPVVVLPVPYGGLSDHHLAFPGTVSFSAATLRGIVEAYLEALVRMGIRDVFVFTSHGGNFGFLTELAADHAGRDDLRLVVYDDLQRYFQATFDGAGRAGFVPPETDWHAGGLETSQGLSAFPELVRDFDGVVGYTAAEDGWLDRVLAEGLDAVSESGVLGSPQGANAEAGAAIFAALVDELAARVEAEFGLTRSH